MLPQSAEQCEVVQPPALPSAEVFELIELLAGRARQEILEGGLQQLRFAAPRMFVIGFTGGEPGDKRKNVFLGQQTIANQ
ncbi:MAG: hypothetical protein R3C56_38290 [Pirellulaceae bacterium]